MSNFNLACGECSVAQQWTDLADRLHPAVKMIGDSERSIIASHQAMGADTEQGEPLEGAVPQPPAALTDLIVSASSGSGTLLAGLELARVRAEATPCDPAATRCARFLLLSKAVTTVLDESRIDLVRLMLRLRRS